MPNPAPLPPEVVDFVDWVATVLADVYFEERSTKLPPAEPPAAEDPEDSK